MKRREVLQAGSAAAFLSVVPFSMAANRPFALVHDVGYAPARMLAAATGQGAFALPADPVALWRDGLAGAPRIAGLTTYSDMLMFADLARAGGRRPTLRIAHHLHDTGAVHVVHAGSIAARSLDLVGLRWPIALCALFGGPPTGGTIERNDRRGTLWSWTIE